MRDVGEYRVATCVGPGNLMQAVNLLDEQRRKARERKARAAEIGKHNLVDAFSKELVHPGHEIARFSRSNREACRDTKTAQHHVLRCKAHLVAEERRHDVKKIVHAILTERRRGRALLYPGGACDGHSFVRSIWKSQVTSPL